MRTRPDAIRTQDPLDRRLALLGEELAWLRPESLDEAPVAGPGLTPGGPTRPGAPGERTSHGSDEPPARPWWDEHTRVRQTPAPAAVGARPEPVPSAGRGSDRARVAAPGRHADRRPTPSRADEVPGLRGAWGDRDERGGVLAAARVLLGPAQLAVVAGVVVVALAATCWWLVRGRPDATVALQSAPAAGLTTAPGADSGSGVQSDPVQSDPVQSDPVQQVAATPAAVGSASTATAATAGSTAPSATITVDVSGRVRHPGIQVLATGARIADALTAAGGAAPGVDLTSLNLAQVLADGQQILVGVRGADGTAGSSVSGATGSSSVPGSPSSAAAGGAAVGVVDLNTATAEQLDALPDVGPVTAQSILSWRDAHGRFSSVDELLEVDGIGQVTLGKLAPYVTV